MEQIYGMLVGYTLVFILSQVAVHASDKQHVLFKDMGMILQHESNILDFKGVQSFEGLLELQRPDLTTPDTIQSKLTAAKSAKQSSYTRCVLRVPEFLEEEDGYMRIVEDDLLSFYADLYNIAAHNREDEPSSASAKQVGKVKRSIIGGNAEESEPYQKIGQLHSYRADEHTLRIIHRTSSEIRNIQRTEDCNAEFLIHFESKKRFEVWQYTRKVDSLRSNFRQMVLRNDEFVRRHAVLNGPLAATQYLKELTRLTKVEVKSINVTRDAIFVQFVVEVPITSQQMLPLYKVEQTGFHHRGMSECAIFMGIPDYVTISNGTILAGCEKGLCDIDLASPACFNGTVNSCAVRKIKCFPARVFSNSAGILIATTRNLTKTMKSGKIVKLTQEPSYYISWDQVSHVTLENVHYPETAVYFNPGDIRDGIHVVMKPSAINFSEFDNFTLFNSRMKDLFNTSKEEDMMRYHIHKEQIAMENVIKSGGSGMLAIQWGLGIVGAGTFLILLVVVLYSCRYNKLLIGYSKINKGCVEREIEAGVKMQNKNVLGDLTDFSGKSLYPNLV